MRMESAISVSKTVRSASRISVKYASWVCSWTRVDAKRGVPMEK
jgi:hypothetical protein